MYIHSIVLLIHAFLLQGSQNSTAVIVFHVVINSHAPSRNMKLQPMFLVSWHLY